MSLNRERTCCKETLRSVFHQADEACDATWLQFLIRSQVAFQNIISIISAYINLAADTVASEGPLGSARTHAHASLLYKSRPSSPKAVIIDGGLKQQCE